MGKERNSYRKINELANTNYPAVQMKNPPLSIARDFRCKRRKPSLYNFQCCYGRLAAGLEAAAFCDEGLVAGIFSI